MVKRKHEEVASSKVIYRPPAGHPSFKDGAAVRDGLATGTRQALVSLQQQVLTLTSSLPLPINHPTITILQQYLDVSPTADELFTAWRRADEVKDDKLAETAVSLLARIIRILTPLPFFHSRLVGIVNKLINAAEPYHDLLNRLIQSGKRDGVHAGVNLASAAINVDPIDPASTLSGRLALRVWTTLADGGSVKVMGKLLGMRWRNKEGSSEYGDKDPLDRPDIRHFILTIVLPMLSNPVFHTHAKSLLPSIYSGLALDPPITIYRVLTSMWAAITLPTPGIARRISLVLFDESAIDHLLKLLPREDIYEGRAVGELVAGFLEGITASPGRGVCFDDEGWYPREDGDDGKQRRGLHNRILSNAIKRVGGRAVDDARVGDWVVKVLSASPELVAGYWPNSALNIEPRLSARWIASMAFVGRIIALPPPPRSIFDQPTPKGSLSSDLGAALRLPPTVASVVESVLPAPLTKAHLSKGLQHADPLVQHVTALSLARGLQKLVTVQSLFKSIENQSYAEPGASSENPWSVVRRELELECRRRVPEVSVIIAFAQKSATMAPPEIETEEDQAIAARSAMLTESALRLLGLYHKSLPSIASEARFDVGKLLVSASSQTAERRARRDAREGSVISDSGSVGSVGTLGTVGMGGGFGHTRGDVEGFEALSQLHVIRLLADVRDWNWTNKAAGSQYTYLYHVLQLHLSTRNPITQGMTTTLLRRLLIPSLLFEHDPSELDLWLDAMPRASDVASGPLFLAQQIHLLSFIDECARRALKTPHRYIEEIKAIASGKPNEVATPLLATMIEQLAAKINGQLIATEAATVVISYLRRVLISLLGKQRSPVFVQRVVERLMGIVVAAKEAGQPRQGLLELVNEIVADVAFTRASVTEAPALVDESDYVQRSFERQLIDSLLLKTADFLIQQISPANAAHHGQLLLHALGAHSDPALLELLRTCMQRATISSQRLKTSVFEDEHMKGLLLSGKADSLLDDLVDTLDSSPHDIALTEMYTQQILKTKGPRQLGRWARFYSPKQMEEAIGQAMKARDVQALEQLVLRTSNPALVAPHLDTLITLGVAQALGKVLRTASNFGITSLKVTDASLKTLVESNATDLLTFLAPANKVELTAVFSKLSPRSDLISFLPVIERLSDLEPYVTFAVSALCNVTLDDTIHRSAISILKSLSQTGSSTVEAALAGVTAKSFNLAFARASQEFKAKHLVDVGLQAVTRMCSSDTPLAGEELAVIKALNKAVELAEPESDLAEDVITAVVAERLSNDDALELAATLAKRVTLKAAFVRKMLQPLLASKQVARRNPSTSFVRLLHGLFLASTYASCQPNFIEPLVLLYGGTLSQSDRLLLSIFQVFEKTRKLSTASILRTWSASGVPSKRAFEALNSVDPGKIFATCLAFPIRRTFEAGKDHDGLYDPVFILSLLAATLQEDLTGFDWVEVLRTNVFGLAICGLSSRDASIRSLSGYVLQRATTMISSAAFQEQPQLLHTLEVARHAVPPPPAGTHTQARLSSLIALFLAHCLRTIASPSHFLYPIASRFILQRPRFDAGDVPLLFSMLYSSGEGYKRERAWIVRLIRDGTRSEADWRILRRRNTFSLLASLYQTSVDVSFRRTTLQAILSMTRVPSAAKSLTLKSGLVDWLSTQWGLATEEERRIVSEILEEVAVNVEQIRQESQVQ